MAWLLTFKWTPDPLAGVCTPDLSHLYYPIPHSFSMDTVNPALASVFLEVDAAALWSKLKDNNPYSRLHSKYWGSKIEHEAEQWRESNPTVNDPTNDIGPGCHALNLGLPLPSSRLWVRNDYVRIYDFCSTRIAGQPSVEGEMVPSVIITGQPGIGVFLSPVASCAFSIDRKGKHSGLLTPPVVVSAKGNLSFGIEIANATYLSRMECLNYPLMMSLAMNLRRSYGLL